MSDKRWVDKQELLQAFRRGDQEAYRHLYILHHRKLFYLAQGLVTSVEEAEDIVANVFIKIWEKKEDIKDLINLEAYMTQMVKNACFDYLKHLRRKDSSQQEIAYLSDKHENELENRLIKAELLQKILLIIEQMPPKMKEIYKLMILEGKNVSEIAAQLDLAPETIRVQKARALAFIKERLNDNQIPLLILFMLLTGAI